MFAFIMLCKGVNFKIFNILLAKKIETDHTLQTDSLRFM